VTVGVAAGIIVAIAALVVGLLALTRHAASPTPAVQKASVADTTDADKTLCTTIAPLLKRSETDRNAFVHTGPAGSPERDAALPKFVDDTKQWAQETQQALNSDPGPPRHITRTLQRYIDDMLHYVEGIRPGRGNKYDEQAWVDASESENGPIMVCYGVGVKW
jgi:hypothetical protein